MDGLRISANAADDITDSTPVTTPALSCSNTLSPSTSASEPLSPLPLTSDESHHGSDQNAKQSTSRTSLSTWLPRSSLNDFITHSAETIVKSRENGILKKTEQTIIKGFRAAFEVDPVLYSLDHAPASSSRTRYQMASAQASTSRDATNDPVSSTTSCKRHPTSSVSHSSQSFTSEPSPVSRPGTATPSPPLSSWEAWQERHRPLLKQPAQTSVSLESHPALADT